jgi:hypothetical protein
MTTVVLLLALLGFEYGYWNVELSEANLNLLGAEGWCECTLAGTDNGIVCSRPVPWSTTFQWKAFPLPKRATAQQVADTLNAAGADNYDQCLLNKNKTIAFCSRPTVPVANMQGER